MLGMYVHGPIPLGQHHVSPGQHHVGWFSSISRATYQKDRLAIPSCVNPLNVWLYTGVHVFTHTDQPITCDAHSALMPHQRKSVLPSSHQTLSALSLHCPVSRPPPRLLWIEQTQADRRTHTDEWRYRPNAAQTRLFWNTLKVQFSIDRLLLACFVL